jgi:uncharacterized protein YndB with AHSA1/START domain
MAMEGDTVSVSRVIAAPAARIFELLADASKHPVIDGSGTVKEATGSSEPLRQGSTFGMKMRIGVPYQMVNHVIEFEQDRRIAWQPRMRGPLSPIVGGRIWRYVLEPLGDGATTRVTESWDLSQDTLRAFLKRGPMPEKTRENMTKTLDRIAEVLADS